MEKTSGGTRLRVFFPDDAWERFKTGSELLGMEERRFVETCALIGLRMLTVSIINPLASPEIQEGVQAAADRQAAELAKDIESLKS